MGNLGVPAIGSPSSGRYGECTDITPFRLSRFVYGEKHIPLYTGTFIEEKRGVSDLLFKEYFHIP